MPPRPELRTQFVEPGQVFTRLTVEREVPGSKRPRLADCRCQCGTSVTLPIDSLVSGNSRSCGCLFSELVAARNRERRLHGMRSHLLYSTWRGMLNRCEKQRDPAWPRYGGRGITVAAEWHDGAAFVAWITENLGPRPDGCSLDRIDNDGNYEPGNVRWATAVEQAANRRKRRTRVPPSPTTLDS
jgi:hypothetical protein